MNQRLDSILRRKDELTELLATQEVAADSKRYTELSREYAGIEPVAEAISGLRKIQQQIQDNLELLDESDCDKELRMMVESELSELNTQQTSAEDQLRLLLLPKDPNDARNVILEVRAGTGGDEAALFAATLFRMYTRFSEQQHYKVEILSSNATGIGGYKEIIAQISGRGAFSRFKFESGVHRVQRIPVTETSGRIHTSACTVATLPEADEVDIKINQEELRIDVYRASGPGGQCVNTTDSAVRITHIPTATVVICQDEKSQHKNREKAMKVLQARLYDRMQAEADAERAEARRGMVGSGDRSERIRTYNFPQARVTDHRINLTLYKLESILDGNMDELLDSLLAHEQATLLADQGA